MDELTEPGQGAEVCVQAAVAHRDNPTVKHGDWIEQRKELEANMPKHCNEVIMIDKEGRVSEGGRFAEEACFSFSFLVF